VLTQTDGAALFDADGRLLALGALLIPTADAEVSVGPVGGTRHTSARRYSHDDPEAVVIAVSEDGPVTVFRRGDVIGRSHPT
jgi:DNA integrity scanning protein DisA with diadenylate cyclase activity